MLELLMVNRNMYTIRLIHGNIDIFIFISLYDDILRRFILIIISFYYTSYYLTIVNFQLLENKASFLQVISRFVSVPPSTIIFTSCNSSEPNITCHDIEEFENA